MNQSNIIYDDDFLAEVNSFLASVMLKTTRRRVLRLAREGCLPYRTDARGCFVFKKADIMRYKLLNESPVKGHS